MIKGCIDIEDEPPNSSGGEPIAGIELGGGSMAGMPLAGGENESAGQDSSDAMNMSGGRAEMSAGEATNSAGASGTAGGQVSMTAGTMSGGVANTSQPDNAGEQSNFSTNDQSIIAGVDAMAADEAAHPRLVNPTMLSLCQGRWLDRRVRLLCQVAIRWLVRQQLVVLRRLVALRRPPVVALVCRVTTRSWRQPLSPFHSALCALNVCDPL